MQQIWSRMLLFYFLMMALGVVAMVWQGNASSLVPPAELSAWLKSLFGGVGIGLLVVWASRLAHNRWAWAERLTGEFRSILGDVTPRQAASIALLSGLGEEVLFRGVLQPALGLWITAAVFGLLHIGPNPRFVPWTIMAFGAGLLFGGMVVWDGNLLSAVVAHVTINYLNLRFLAAAEDPDVIHLGSRYRAHHEATDGDPTSRDVCSDDEDPWTGLG